MKLSTEYQWQEGDAFFKSGDPKKTYLIRRVKGDTIFYYSNQGIDYTCKQSEPKNWVIIEG